MQQQPFLAMDFGTSNSVIAWHNPQTGTAEIIGADFHSSKLFPSLVYYDEHGAEVGHYALQRLEDSLRIYA